MCISGSYVPYPVFMSGFSVAQHHSFISRGLREALPAKFVRSCDIIMRGIQMATNTVIQAFAHSRLRTGFLACRVEVFCSLVQLLRFAHGRILRWLRE